MQIACLQNIMEDKGGLYDFATSRMQGSSCTLCLHNEIDLGINDVCRNVDTGVEQRPELLMLSVTTVVAMNGRKESGARVDCAMRCGTVLDS